ncbi:signal peptidase I [Bartonella sp. TP]|uniref:signal peptidase I n=1 Tax=Bartonella sp. TP TaxID=3057550 RepID=UPI0025B13D7B|nr:signal peptidase I [Bartonella sp. TP]MDN5249288.1 signal peptidase I [Alphaproteobacteria bacterium]WJW80142.1 signal peptidase I [Bartonella sp. TP]
MEEATASQDSKIVFKKKENSTLEHISVFVQAILVALLIRTFLFQPFVIPSGSMRPTLLVGDYIFVSKYSYGYSRFSLPYGLPLLHGRIFGHQPNRGDVVVFSHVDTYDSQRKDFIKRLIGLPGDRIQVRDGVLYINDKMVSRRKLYAVNDYDVTGHYGPVDCYLETLPNGISYNTLDLDPQMRGNNTQLFTVPAEHYFMMGDNRDDSEDSRFSLHYIAKEELVGRANLIFFSLGKNTSGYQFWRWPSSIRWNRLFTFVNKLNYNV